MKINKIALVSLAIVGSLFSKGFDVKQNESKPVDEIGGFVSLTNDISDGKLKNTTIVVNELNFNNREVKFQAQRDLIIDCKNSRIGNGVIKYAPKKIINPNYIPKIELNNCSFIDLTIWNGVTNLPLKVNINNSKGKVYIKGSKDNKNTALHMSSSKIEYLKTDFIFEKHIIQSIIDLYETDDRTYDTSFLDYKDNYIINSIIKNTKNISASGSFGTKAFFINSILTSSDKIGSNPYSKESFTFINSFVKVGSFHKIERAINSIIKSDVYSSGVVESSYISDSSSDIRKEKGLLTDKEFENIPFIKPKENSILKYKGISPDKVSELVIIPSKYQKYLYVDMLGNKRDLNTPTVGPFEISGGKKGF